MFPHRCTAIPFHPEPDETGSEAGNTQGRGKVRVLSIPAIRDRVVQDALNLILEPIFEADFQPGSFGYRPKKTAHEEAVERMAEVGGTGTGKSHIAIGLARIIIRTGKKARFYNAVDLAEAKIDRQGRTADGLMRVNLVGIYVVQTSLPADKLGAKQAVAGYKSLALVERGFRTLKGVDMQVRLFGPAPPCATLTLIPWVGR